MSQTTSGPQRSSGRAAMGRLRWVLAAALATALMAAAASAASAATVRVVSQTKSGTNIYPTIQGAVNAAKPKDWVLIEPGTYDETVRVETPGLKIRGMDRNGVILDGHHELGQEGEGRNGIEVFKTSNVSIENLTVRDFDRATQDGSDGNEIWG